MKNNITKWKLVLVAVMAMVMITSCHNNDIEFDNYDTTSCFFSYQTPIRTLILGEYNVGLNDNDNAHRFEIAVVMSGVYENEKDRYVHFKVDETLLDHVSGIKALPTSYYTIETESPVVISKGNYQGRIVVQLNDAFFADTAAVAALYETNYVVPLVIEEVEGIDLVLRGEALSSVTSPIRTKANDWEVLPKDYTLFGIKYINKYEANYLRRGVDYRMDANGGAIDNVVYHETYVEKDEVTKITTKNYTTAYYSTTVRRAGQDNAGACDVELVFDDNDNCTIYSSDGVKIGSGKYVEESELMLGDKVAGIYLDFEYLHAETNEIHHVMDTLVARDRGVIFEQFTIVDK